MPMEKFTFTLSFNGTGLTNEGGVFSDLSPVEDGSYTFWGYEHFLTSHH
jgi:hypothetical protein